MNPFQSVFQDSVLCISTANLALDVRIGIVSQKQFYVVNVTVLSSEEKGRPP